MKHPFSYSHAGRPRDTLCMGVASHILRRVWQHEQDLPTRQPSEP